jgi:hypothetical protein
MVEVDTPNLAFVARAPGDYRIAVAPDGSTTDVTVLRGAGDVYGDGTQLALVPGQTYRFGGQDLNNYVLLPPAPPDDFDRWALARDQRLERAVARRYVPQGVVGVEDLDDYGTWRAVPDYGTVWVPDRAPRNWAPYHTGHWTWIDPWGWTWVDDQPWGYAVSHYGRWVRTPDTWAWVPAPVQARPVYAPALVVFVGTALAVGSWSGPGVGWFPLAPYEPYRPPYRASPTYVTNINVTNTVIHQTTIVNNINNVTNIRYVNRNVPGAMVAMPAPQFASAAPTVRSGLVLPPGVARAAPVLVAPQARPLPQSRIGTQPGHRPPAPVLQRMAVTRALPPGAFMRADRHAPAGPDARLAARAPVPPLRVLRPAIGRQVTPQPWRGPAPDGAAGGHQFARVGQPGGPGARGPQPAQPGQPGHGLAGPVPVARDMHPDHRGGVPQPHGRFVPGAPAMQAEGPGRPAAPPPGGHPQAPRAPDAAPGRAPADVAQHGGRTPPQGRAAQVGPHWAARGGVPTAQASGPMEGPAAHGDAGRTMNRHGRPAAPPQTLAAQAGPQPAARGQAPHPSVPPQRAAMQASQPATHGPASQPHPRPDAHPPAPHRQPRAAPQAPAPRPQPQAAPYAPTPRAQPQAAQHSPAPRPQPSAQPPAQHAPKPAPQPAPKPAPHAPPRPAAQAPRPQPQPQSHAAPQHGPDKGGDHGRKRGEQGGH